MCFHQNHFYIEILIVYMENEIRKLVVNINNEVFLPGLQREFVWNQQMISKLFDSMIRNYPIGAITIWNVKHEDDYYPYRFIKNFNHGGRTTPLGDKFKRFNDLADKSDARVLIIDGQQRLNSILIGLNGSIADYAGGRGGSKGSKDNWEEQVLCIDLLGHPNSNNEMTFQDYSFEFRKIGKGLEDKTKHDYEGDKGVHRYWMPLRDFCEDDAMYEKGALKKTAKEAIANASIEANQNQHEEFMEIARDVAGDLYSNVLTSNIEFEEATQDNREVKEIFRRLNLQKKDPQAYQLLQSNLMSQVALDDNKDINPREEIKKWIQYFQERYSTFEDGLDRKFFMRYSCYLSDIPLRKTAIKELQPADIKTIEEKWKKNESEELYDDKFGHFRNSLEKALDTVKDLGFNEDSIGSMSMVALLAKFYYEYPEVDHDSKKNQEEVLKFLSQSLLLNQSYGILRRSKARDMAQLIHRKKYPSEREDEYDLNYDDYDITQTFPRKMILDGMGFHAATKDINNTVNNTKYKKGQGDVTFTNTDVAAVLGLLDDTYSGEEIKQFQVDHIFPQKDEKVEEIKKAAGTEDIDIHRIGNLQLILRGRHKDKLEKWPKEWFTNKSDSIEEEIKSKNLYPDIELKPGNFKEFVEAREEKIKSELKNKYVKETE